MGKFSIENVLDFKLAIVGEMSKSVTALREDEIAEAGNIILESVRNGGRVHITGIGKPGDLAHYLASSFSSVGIPTYYLDATAASHGGCGQLDSSDAVIYISNSGNTTELKMCFEAVKLMGVKTIGVTGNQKSFLKKNCNATIIAHVDAEGGPLNLAPRASILAEAAAMQALSVYVQSEMGFTADDFHKRHQAGALGEMLKNSKVF